MREGVGVACVLVACAVTGCASPQPVTVEPASDEPWIQSVLPPGDDISGASLYPRDATTIVFDIVEGKGSGETLTYARAAADRFDAAWQEAEVDRQTEFLRAEADGSIVMTAAIDHEEEAITLFDPPLTVGFARMTAGEEYRSEASMRIVSETNPGRQLESGTCVSTIRYVDDVMIMIGGRSYRAHRLEARFTADLRFASADKSAVRYFVPGIGVLVEERRKLVKVLGVTRTDAHQVLVATSAGPR